MRMISSGCGPFPSLGTQCASTPRFRYHREISARADDGIQNLVRGTKRQNDLSREQDYDNNAGGFQFRRMKGGIFTLLTAGKGSPPLTLNFWKSVDGTF